MPVISDETGIYAIGPDGEKIYGCTTNFQVDGKTLYDFNQETGVLQVSIAPGDLERLLDMVGKIPEEGKDVNLPTQIGLARFKGVKKIESLPGVKKGKYLMTIKK